MKKVIYINYIKQYGHINFDKIHINALVSQGYDVKIIMHKDIANKLPYSKEIYALVLPTWMGYSSKNGIINRLVYIATLLFIKFKISFKSYNYCIISNLDEISMALCPLTKDMFLICHGNSKNFTNAIKKIFLHKLALSCTFIVFNNQMAKPFLKNESRNIYYMLSLLFCSFLPHLQHVEVPGPGIEPVPHGSGQSYRGENAGALTC